MSVVRAYVFDELDTGSDIVSVFRAVISFSPPILSTNTPDGTGKSIGNDVGQVSAYQIFSFEDQAGKEVYYQEWLYIPSSPTVGTLISFCSGSIDGSFGQLTLRLSSAAKLELYRGSTKLTETTMTFSEGWYQIDAKVLVANASGVFTLWVNGNTTAEIDFTGDTQNQSTNSVVALRLGQDGSAISASEDILHYRPIIFNNDGTKDNGRVPSNIKHEILHTVADTANIFTPSTGSTVYNLIDELMGAPTDTDYGSSNTLNERNVCELTALPADVSRVIALIPNSRIGKPEAGTVGLKVGITDGTSETQSAEKFLSASFTNYGDVFEYLTGSTEYDIADTLYVSTEITTAG